MRVTRYALTLAALITLVASCSSSTDSRSTTSTTGAAPSSTRVDVATTTTTPSPSASAILAAAGNCTGCTVVARVDNLRGPTGAVTVALVERRTAIGSDHIVVAIDEGGRRLYDQTIIESMIAARRTPVAQDRSGNVIFNFEAGAHNGVVVVVWVTRSGVSDLGSIRRFESNALAAIRDVNGDGYLDIGIRTNDCVPSCAQGATTTRWFVWNGTDYVTSR